MAVGSPCLKMATKTVIKLFFIAYDYFGSSVFKEWIESFGLLFLWSSSFNKISPITLGYVV